MSKAHLFINGCSLKNRCNNEHGLLSLPQRAGLETFYAALLMLTRDYHFLQSMPCLNTFLIPAEPCIFRWLGYKNLMFLLRQKCNKRYLNTPTSAITLLINEILLIPSEAIQK